VLGTIYVIYFVIRAMLLANPAPPLAPAAPPVRGASHDPPPVPPPVPRPAGADLSVAIPIPKPPRRLERLYRERAMTALPVKPARQSLTELLGSLLLGAGVATAMAVVLSLLHNKDVDAALIGWLATVGTLGAWGVLIPSKFWEGTVGEPILRRFVLLCVGLALGFLAFAVEREFLVDLPNELKVHAGPAPVEPVQRLAMYVAYFGFLLPILRWWRQADPLRRSRFSVWATGVCIFWAGLLGAAWQFPQPGGMMAAATMAISIQLAAPWVEHHRRFARQVV
jgi:hypothetical protein